MFVKTTNHQYCKQVIFQTLCAHACVNTKDLAKCKLGATAWTWWSNLLQGNSPGAMLPHYDRIRRRTCHIESGSCSSPSGCCAAMPSACIADCRSEVSGEGIVMFRTCFASVPYLLVKCRTQISAVDCSGYCWALQATKCFSTTPLSIKCAARRWM